MSVSYRIFVICPFYLIGGWLISGKLSKFNRTERVDERHILKSTDYVPVCSSDRLYGGWWNE